ncbi:hypothetical protein D0817_20130 [Flavobacterium cupreum]|uniref:Uncharacterized protein n=1 Tax=Flavobacterium cupreum TaxID=2133766 RepID=A0A434A2Q3_9FLAO|nr:hypothetical protein [Flavobacterium cupreum]RUT68671.1 hypothetical protein D0817_20130 [Flavobacterium cupreum]
MLTRSQNHSHFWTENKIVYESYNTIRGLRFREVAILWFFYPDHQKLTQPMLNYLNKRFESKPDEIEVYPDEPQQDQLSLF